MSFAQKGSDFVTLRYQVPPYSLYQKGPIVLGRTHMNPPFWSYTSGTKVRLGGSSAKMYRGLGRTCEEYALALALGSYARCRKYLASAIYQENIRYSNQ